MTTLRVYTFNANKAKNLKDNVSRIFQVFCFITDEEMGDQSVTLQQLRCIFGM